MTPEVHDKRVAVISHMILDLSHYIFEFVNSKHPEALNIAGDSFITTTRLASDNPRMLTEINEMNSLEIEKIIKEFIYFLKAKTSMDTPDHNYFLSNKNARDSWVHFRNKG